MPTSQRPALMASNSAVSFANGAAAKFDTQPLTTLLAVACPWFAIIVATKDWLYTLLEVRKHNLPFHFGSAKSA